MPFGNLHARADDMDDAPGRHGTCVHGDRPDNSPSGIPASGSGSVRLRRLERTPICTLLVRRKDLNGRYFGVYSPAVRSIHEQLLTSVLDVLPTVFRGFKRDEFGCT